MLHFTCHLLMIHLLFKMKLTTNYTNQRVSLRSAVTLVSSDVLIIYDDEDGSTAHDYCLVSCVCKNKPLENVWLKLRADNQKKQAQDDLGFIYDTHSPLN